MSAPLNDRKTPWGPVRFTVPFVVLPGGCDVVIIGQKTLREKLGIDIMAQLKASVLKAKGVKMALGWSFQLVLWASPTIVVCCERRWLSHRSRLAATRLATWTMRSH